MSCPLEQFGDLLDERTRLVAVTGASNVLGTRPHVRAITDAAHTVGALTYVDGVHSTAHGVTDIAELGSDFYVTSAYKWDGPHVGCLVADPALLERLTPFKLASSSNDVPDRFEWGTPSFANFAGVTAAVDHLAAMDDDGVGLAPRTCGAIARPLLTSTRRCSSTACWLHLTRTSASRSTGTPSTAPRPSTSGSPVSHRSDDGAPRRGRHQCVARAQLRVGSHPRARHPRRRAVQYE